MQNLMEIAGVLLGGMALAGLAVFRVLDKKYPQKEPRHTHKDCPVCHRCLICGEDTSSIAF